MKSVALMFPVMPGKEEEGRKFMREVNRRKQEHTQSRLRLGVTRESVWLQQTPQGSFGILLLEGEDALESNRKFAASKEPYDVWFKEQLVPITGIDWSQPVPPVESMLEWRAPAPVGAGSR